MFFYRKDDQTNYSKKLGLNKLSIGKDDRAAAIFEEKAVPMKKKYSFEEVVIPCSPEERGSSSKRAKRVPPRFDHRFRESPLVEAIPERKAKKIRGEISEHEFRAEWYDSPYKERLQDRLRDYSIEQEHKLHRGIVLDTTPWDGQDQTQKVSSL